MTNKNSKTSESRKFPFNLTQRCDLISLSKHVALQKLSIYDTWKNIRQQF